MPKLLVSTPFFFRKYLIHTTIIGTSRVVQHGVIGFTQYRGTHKQFIFSVIKPHCMRTSSIIDSRSVVDLKY